MKITFPHLGDAHLIGRIFFHEIGIEILTPSMNSLKGLEEGSANSPDEICLPFKFMVSNLMEAYRMGADTVIMPATMGPCRLGEYGELLKSVLDKKGYPFRWIIIDSSKAIGKKELLNRLAQTVQDSTRSKIQILSALRNTYKLINQLEELDNKAFRLCGYETKKGDCKRILNQCRRKLSAANSIRHGLNIIKHYDYFLDRVPIDKTKQPLNLLLTGEIYSLIEPFASHRVAEMLMDMGVSFQKRITLGWWIKYTLLNPFELRPGVVKKNEYLPYHIGGYAKETVEEGLLCNVKNFDGVIQIFPVGCMPEIVAKAVLSTISKELNIKVLNVIFDEMGGEAGYITRIEAFIDMLDRRKKIQRKGLARKEHENNTKVLYGN